MLGYEYLDSSNQNYWWTIKYIHYAKIKTYEQAYKIFAKKIDYGKIIK
jgi:hypothetical protein